MKNSLVFLLLVALASCQTLQQADKALYDGANRFSSKDLVTGERKLNFASREEQIKQGNAEALKIISDYESKGARLNEKLDANQYSRLQNIFKNIHQVSHLRDEVWQVVLLPEKEFNAFVTGGTFVFVNYGLMQSSPFDDEIAAVISHEISHVSANHVFERNASNTASMLAGSKLAKSSFMQSAYSQKDELEADKIGVLYMTLAGYDPEASARVWEKIYSRKGNDGQVISTHPLAGQRLAQNRQTVNAVKQYLVPGQINPNYAYILEHNPLWNKGSFTSSIPAGAGGGIASMAETALNYYKEKQQAKQISAENINRVMNLKEVEKNMKILGARKLDDGKIALDIQYTGTAAITGLAIKAVTENSESIYRHQEAILPNQNFSAVFGSELFQNADGNKPKMKLVVDEAYYSN